MTYPKMRPCPQCQSDEHLEVYTYDSGWTHVECNKCFYLGPGEGSHTAAIKAHNERADECGQCGGSGFDTPGTGYGTVCGKCGGQRTLPSR